MQIKIFLDGTKCKICFVHQWFILKKENEGSFFFIRKNTKRGGGSREVWQITRLFRRFFFVKPSLTKWEKISKKWVKMG